MSRSRVVVANLRVVVDTVSAAIGSLPAIYCSPSWWNGNINSSAFTLDPLWVANWFVSSPGVPANNWGGTGWQVWQFSDAGSIPGIPGRVDLDQAGTRSLPFYGWPDPVALPAANVASGPQLVSDQPGDIDVLWRGTNNQVWTLGYRNGQWGTAAADISAAGGSPAMLTTDPSVVSSGPGRIDAFWEGTDGNLWQVTYTAGWYGSGTWSAPVSLGLGPLGSEPEAVSPGPGLIDVFWKGSDGSIWVDRFNGTWSGATPLGSGAITGNPVAVSAAVGSDTVFWRSATGDLWQDTGASWGWTGPQQLTTTPLAADPSVSASGGDIDVFWDSAGVLWHGALNAGVWSGAASLGTVGVQGNPAAVALAPGAVIVDARESGSGTLASSLYTAASGLVGPEGLGAVPGSDPSSVAFAGGGAIDVLWRSTTNVLWYAPACPGCAAPAVPVFSLSEFRAARRAKSGMLAPWPGCSTRRSRHWTGTSLTRTEASTGRRPTPRCTPSSTTGASSGDIPLRARHVRGHGRLGGSRASPKGRPGVVQDFAAIWRAADKIVYSTSLDAVSTREDLSRARLRAGRHTAAQGASEARPEHWRTEPRRSGAQCRAGRRVPVVRHAGCCRRRQTGAAARRSPEAPAAR